MITLPQSELEELYSVYVFANTPSYLYKHTRSLLAAKQDIAEVEPKDVEDLFKKGLEDEQIFFNRLGLCLASFLQPTYVESLGDRFHKDHWWKRLYAFALSDAAKKDAYISNQNTVSYSASTILIPSRSVSNNSSVIISLSK